MRENSSTFSKVISSISSTALIRRREFNHSLGGNDFRPPVSPKVPILTKDFKKPCRLNSPTNSFLLNVAARASLFTATCVLPTIGLLFQGSGTPAAAMGIVNRLASNFNFNKPTTDDAKQNVSIVSDYPVLPNKVPTRRTISPKPASPMSALRELLLGLKFLAFHGRGGVKLASEPKALSFAGSILKSNGQ